MEKAAFHMILIEFCTTAYRIVEQGGELAHPVELLDLLQRSSPHPWGELTAEVVGTVGAGPEAVAAWTAEAALARPVSATANLLGCPRRGGPCCGSSRMRPADASRSSSR